MTDNKKSTTLKMHKVLTNIPEEFVVEQQAKNGAVQYFVRFGGLMFLANQMGKPILQTRNVSIDPSKEIVYECVGYLVPNEETLASLGITGLDDPRLKLMLGTPTVAHGTTNGANLNSTMQKYAEVMAETRAEVRCLRLLTGCSYTAYDELDSADFRVAPVEVTNAAKMYAMEDLGGATTRQDMCKELSMLATVTPYSGILAKVYKDNKTTTLSGLSDEVIKSMYGTCIGILKGEQKTLF